MTRSRTTAGKRNVQQQKREKAQAKRERRAARKDADTTGSDAIHLDTNEGELIEKLAGLHGALEAGRMTPQAFEEGREHIRSQLELIARLGH